MIIDKIDNETIKEVVKEFLFLKDKINEDIRQHMLNFIMNMLLDDLKWCIKDLNHDYHPKNKLRNSMKLEYLLMLINAVDIEISNNLKNSGYIVKPIGKIMDKTIEEFPFDEEYKMKKCGISQSKLKNFTED